MGVTHVNVLFLRGKFEVRRDVDLFSFTRYSARWKMCIGYKIFVTEPFPFVTHWGFGPCEVRVVAMLVHVESAFVTVVSAASAGVTRLGITVEARVTWYLWLTLCDCLVWWCVCVLLWVESYCVQVGGV